MSELHPVQTSIAPPAEALPFQPGLNAERRNGRREAVAVGFDPLADLLVAQKVRPAHLGPVNFRALTSFQRALMVIDGTVTKFIEAYTMEPVKVVRLAQEMHCLACDHPWLEMSQGSTVVARQVMLQGRHHGTLYAYAVSLLVLERLPAGVREDLEVNPGGLGRVLLAHHLETRREILWYGREHIKDLPEPVARMTDGKFISRAYRIMAQEKPLMLINEKFPLGTDPLLMHH